MKSALYAGLCAVLFFTLAACTIQQASVNMSTVQTIPKDAALRYLKFNYDPSTLSEWPHCIIQDDVIVVDGKALPYDGVKLLIETRAFTETTIVQIIENRLFPQICAYYLTPKDQRGRDSETVNKIATAFLSLGVEVDTK